ncbi:MAG: Tol-Pal system beta propeller repeat protein TolB [Coxiellaceae bacterium]|jgi:TolB protein|nr:Tol-Pal system beta propeller repeat protein TolB [Coxiellaceae bacterium]
MYRLLKLFIIGGLFVANNVFATLKLELTQGVDNALPIAIFPFAGEESIEDFSKITSIISHNLKNSGRFRLVDLSDLNANEVNFAVWRARKIEAVVTGYIKPLGGEQFSVFFKLLDVYNNKDQLFEKEYRVNKNQLRKLAHHLSDIVYQKLTGDRGVFSTKIAYVLVERRGQGQGTIHKLQVADSDGANVHTLLISRFPLMSPTWSPDGKKIAYVSFEGHRAAIYVQKVATGKRGIIAKFPGINGAPAWSPDGNKMALVLTLTGYPKIYILNLADKQLERLTDGLSLDTEPNWSPDGKSLIFTSNRGGSPQIYRIMLNNKKIERITFNGSYNARASFAPSGNAIVMLHQEGEMFSIAYEDLRSHRMVLLTQSGLNESPSLAPNGKMIVYATNSKGHGMLAEVSIDGRVKLLLPAGEGAVQEPAWSPFSN